MKVNLRKVIFIGILSILASLFIPNKVNAATYKDTETGITWYYSTSSGAAYNVYVSSYTTLPETLVIPDKMAGSYPVKGIRGSSTSLTSGNTNRYNILNTTSANTTVKSIILPETLTSIGNNTFANFKGLTSIVIPDTVTSIGAYAFYYCSELKEVTLPLSASLYTYSSSSYSYLPRASFYQCNKIAKMNFTKGTATSIPDYNLTTIDYLPWNSNTTAMEIILPEGITSIGAYAFSYISEMDTFTIPDSVTNISSNAFLYSDMKKIKMSKNITTIAQSAFKNCKFEELELPDTVTSIGKDAFSGCSNWKSENFKLPENLTQLNENVFYGCKNLTGTLEIPSKFNTIPSSCFYGTGFSNIVLPDTITTIKNSAFQRCTNLESIDFPKNLETIGNNAFDGCTSITGDLVFPDTVTTVGSCAFQKCTGFDGKLILGANLSSIGNNAFFGCTGFKEAEIKDGVITKVDDNMFSNFSSVEKVILGDSVKSIGNNAFESCFNLKEIPMNDNIEKIGNNAFQYCTSLKEVKLNDKIETIGNGVFKNCIGLTGDLSFPDNLKNIGENAFEGCTGLNGTVRIGNGISVIENFTFYGCYNIAKLIVPNNVKEIEKFSLWGLSDLYYLGTEDEVEISDIVGGADELFVHYKDCTHKLNIDIPTDYEIINLENNEVLTSSEFACESSLKLAVREKTRNTTNNQQISVLKQGKFKNSDLVEEKFTVSSFGEYEITAFNRDYTILMKDTNVTTDLVLRNYISQLNYNNLSTVRVPNVENESGIISYKHTKLPIEVKTGDIVTIKVRIYNEGDKEGLVNEIVEYLPDGLVLANSETNRNYGWIEGENGKVSTKYFENKPFEAYIGDGEVPFKEIPLICKVTALGNSNTDKRLVLIGEISTAITKDSDSIYGQIISRVDSTYKNEEAYGSTADSYVKSEDDDTDFENVVIKPTMPVEYTIKVTKIDSETQDLLSGAVFNLKDSAGNIVSTAVTDENGVLAFGLITSYGEGTDIFYIEEALAPEGYRLTEKETVEVNVTKTIIDEILGTYSLKVVCQTLNYSTDITRYDYNPIATPEHLAKVGSGEVVEYEGYEYQFTENANYKLVNDIDLSGIEWTPINKKITGIFDGNNHSIKNLTIASNDLFTYSEVGLFRYFSGIVQGLNLENVNIYVPGMITTNQGLESLSGYSGIGGFAGFMEKGTVKSCSISGVIESGCNNVGGFVGHSAQNNIIKFQNCTNSANIKTNRDIVAGQALSKNLYNVGGLIGCAIGSLSLDDCMNEGIIEGNGSNVGGLVGFVQSTGYKEVAIEAQYSEEDKTIGLVIGNTRTNGKYDIILENRDVKTLGFISGAKYTVYDSKLNTISGFEEIQLAEGKLKVATVDIDYVGTDTYYIKEQAPAPGYSKLKTYVKLVVSRKWNPEKEKFEVIANAENIVDQKINAEPKQDNTYKPLESVTGQVFTGITEELIGFYNDKIAMSDCTNKGNVTGYMDIGGLLGTAYCNVQIDKCNNTGNITSSGYGKAGGLISQVKKQEVDNLVEIKNSVNEGDVLSVIDTNSSVYGSASGIIAHSYSNIKLSKCINKGNISAVNRSSVSGMIADLAGTAEIRECTNEGNLSGTNENISSDYSMVVGGIVAKNIAISVTGYVSEIADNNIYIYDCTNTGNIDSKSHSGGMVAYMTGTNLVIENSVNKNNYIYTYNGDNAGMIGYAAVENIDIVNCTTDNSKIGNEEKISNSTGFASGILGTLSPYTPRSNVSGTLVNIKNCKVLNSRITSGYKEVGGIIGGGSSYKGAINIKECDVEKTMLTAKNVSSICGAGGIIGTFYSTGFVDISDCDVKDSKVSLIESTKNLGHDSNIGGIMAGYWFANGIKLTNCNVDNCYLYNGATNDSMANTGGLIGGYACSNPVELINCDVKNTEIKGLSGNTGGSVGLTYNSAIKLTDCDNQGITVFSTATTGQNANTGGFIATASQDVTMDNCTLTGTENNKSFIYGRCRNVGGLVGVQLNYGNTSVTNATVKNVSLQSEGYNYYGSNSSSSYDTVSAVVGSTFATAEFKNCLVENVDIEGTVANAATILGHGRTTTFENINVKNAKVKNNITYAQSSTNSAVGGISGTLNSPGTYINCHIEDSKIIGHGSSEGGFSGMLSGGSFTNCSIKNSSVSKKFKTNNNSYFNGTIGGFVGSAPSTVGVTNCLVDNVYVEGEAMSVGGMFGYLDTASEFKDNTIKDLTIKSESQCNTTSNGAIGGFVGALYSMTSTDKKIENCDITNFIVESGSNHIGGIVGAGNFKAGVDSCDVVNFQAKYTNTIKSEYSPRGIGGIIGIAVYDGKIIKNCTVTDSSIIAQKGQNTKSFLGAFIGYGDYMSFENCDSINNIIINETELGTAGGVIGSSLSSRSFNETTSLWTESYNIINCTDVQIQDSKITSNAATGGIVGYGVVNVLDSGVNKCIIENTFKSGNGVGGIVGMSLSMDESSIKNTVVVDSTITGKDYAGGIAGFASGLIDNCTVNNTTISTDSSECGAGGISGMSYESSNIISNSTVSKSSITGAQYAGGIVGYTEGNLTNNKVNEDSTITTTSSEYSAGGILGLTANSSSEITNCDVDKITVKSVNGYAGGIAGFANNIISGSDVNNATIIATGNEPTNIGGIIGQASSEAETTTVVGTSTIANTTLQTPGNAGKVAGSGLADLTGCTVDEATVVVVKP